MGQGQDLLALAVVAAILGLSLYAVEQMILRGVLETVDLNPDGRRHRYRVLKKDLEAFLGRELIPEEIERAKELAGKK